MQYSYITLEVASDEKMNKNVKSQSERRKDTQAAVLRSACKLFGSNGYDHTSLQDIAADCGTTIRPIYHYFQNKKVLFEVVTETFENQIVEALSQVDSQPGANLNADDYWLAFSKLATDSSFRQVVLVDSPHILGRERWANTVVVKKASEIIQQRFPALQGINRTLFTRMLIGALSEAVMVFAEAKDDEGEELLNQVSALVRALT